jgi:pimeloyl-ACP methyl ester carboxylesterase
MPINMAIFNTGAAEGIIEHFSWIENWAIAGHSVGGTSAAIYTANHLDQIAGLAIWASFPAESTDLSKADLPVYMIYGELDEGVDREGVGARKHLLPPDTVYVEISGGDHHQFGSYLVKEGVDRSTTPRDIQHTQIIQATLELLAGITE